MPCGTNKKIDAREEALRILNPNFKTAPPPVVALSSDGDEEGAVEGGRVAELAKRRISLAEMMFRTGRQSKAVQHRLDMNMWHRVDQLGWDQPSTLARPDELGT